MYRQLVTNDDGEPIGIDYVYEPDPNDWADDYDSRIDDSTITCRTCGYVTAWDCYDEELVVVLAKGDEGFPTEFRIATREDYGDDADESLELYSIYVCPSCNRCAEVC